MGIAYPVTNVTVYVPMGYAIYGGIKDGGEFSINGIRSGPLVLTAQEAYAVRQILNMTLTDPDTEIPHL